MAEESVREEGSDIRRKATARLAVAGLVTALALAALWWLDRSGKAAPAAKPTPPSPIVSAPVAPPPAAPQASDAPGTEPGDAASPPAADAPVAPPPPPAPQMAVPVTPPARANHPPAPAASATPAPRPAAPQPAAASGDYVVQLGVFSNPRNAQELVARLNRQGIRAYTETRVQVGPFRDRAEAEKAQAELKRLGVSGLVGTTK
ncbi:SPOR domain-containing protein [Parasulfuritortus cantonensis]|uniref:SPOR domain-containing protein n=1 Tax=Parasulfuritortus cantonensis TaxID=2528202 RepID=A0A4R1BKQ2_9PROT|nr:SPOR domain-containing protein [Parasulfuritortus cantonensis]TCJ17909.1 SPOR domain-containing protein [Parasulfuritortus cantonensis]